MNPTPETLGKGKGKISSSCQSGSETESFSMRYVRTVHKSVPAYCHSYCFTAKCSFKGLTYAGCVDTCTQPGGKSFLPLVPRFLLDSPKFLVPGFISPKICDCGLLPATELPLLPHVVQHNCSIFPLFVQRILLFLFVSVQGARVLLRSSSPRWRLCSPKAASSEGAV